MVDSWLRWRCCCVHVLHEVGDGDDDDDDGMLYNALWFATIRRAGRDVELHNNEAQARRDHVNDQEIDNNWWLDDCSDFNAWQNWKSCGGEVSNSKHHFFVL